MHIGYPPQVVGLSTLAYCATRFLRRQGVASKDIQPTRSILAGCKYGNNVAMTMIRTALGHLHAAYRPRGISTSSWVDDINQRMEGERSRVRAGLGQAGKALVQLVTADGMRVATKSGAIASDAQLVADIVQDFKI